MYQCPIFRVADVVGKRWAIVVIQEVALHGKEGFNAIYKRMRKVSPKLLSQRLKDLENEGIIEKEVIAHTMPVRTAYHLTKKGEELQKIVEDLRRWQAKHNPAVEGCERRECVNCVLY